MLKLPQAWRLPLLGLGLAWALLALGRCAEARSALERAWGATPSSDPHGVHAVRWRLDARCAPGAPPPGR